MSDIDSNQRSHTRMDQDAQKNVVTPKAGGNDRMQAGHGAPDVEERNRNRIEEERDNVDNEQRLRHRGDQSGDKGVDLENEDMPERDKHNP